MSVKIRLTRVGRRNSPFFRIVVADSRSPRDGRFIEILGVYQPLKGTAEFEVKEDRAVFWLERGAIPSNTVRSIFKKLGILKKFHELRLEKRARKAQASPAS